MSAFRRFTSVSAPPVHDRGRDGDCSPPPAQTRTGPIRASGSYLEWIDPARLAAEELDVEPAFDLFDAPTQWWLLHAELFGGTRDVAFLGDRKKVPQVFEIDDHIENDIDFGRSIGYLASVDDAIPRVI